MFKIDFVIIILGFGILTSFIFAINRIKKMKKEANRTKDFLLQPLLIILTLVLLMSWKISSNVTMLENSTKETIKLLVEDNWKNIENDLKGELELNHELSEDLSIKITNDLKALSINDLEKYINTIGQIENNSIQKIVGDRLKGVYFKGVVSDANDPFAMIIGKGEKDSFIFSDFSENCAIDKLTRNLDEEYSLHANPELAKVAFNKILRLEYGTTLEEIIFFQFNPKEGMPLKSYNFKGLKQLYFDNNYDFDLTFKSIEFISPAYIYRDRSIINKPRIIDRIKTDAKIIAIMSVFSFYEIENQNNTKINSLPEIIKEVTEKSLIIERSLMIGGIFTMLIAILMFILFLSYLNKEGK